MAEMNEKELLSAVLYEVKAIRAKVDATADDLHGFRNEMYEFKNEMYGFRDEMYEFKSEMYGFKDEMYEFKDEMTQFRNETNNNFNKLGRRISLVEADYEQLNTRVDKLELSGNY